MYRAYWGMECNPFDKEIPEKQFYKNNDFNEMTKRLEILKKRERDRAVHRVARHGQDRLLQGVCKRAEPKPV